MCLGSTRVEIEKHQHEIVTLSFKKYCRTCDDLDIDNDFGLYGTCRKTGKLHALDYICIL